MTTIVKHALCVHVKKKQKKKQTKREEMTIEFFFFEGMKQKNTGKL